MKIEDVKYVSEIELSEAIAEFYDRPYVLQQSGYGYDEMLGQDSIVIVDIPHPVDDYEKQEEDQKYHAWKEYDILNQPAEDYPGQFKMKFERGEIVPVPHLQYLVNDLYAAGIMPEGKYIVHVWW